MNPSLVLRGIQNLRTQFYKGQTFSYPTIHWACNPLPNFDWAARAHHCLFLRACRGRLSNACTVNHLPFRYTVMWHRHETIAAIYHQKTKGIFQNSLKLLAKIMPWRMSWNMSQKMSWNYALAKCPEIMPWQNVLKNVLKKWPEKEDKTFGLFSSGHYSGPLKCPGDKTFGLKWSFGLQMNRPLLFFKTWILFGAILEVVVVTFTRRWFSDSGTIDGKNFWRGGLHNWGSPPR